MLMKDFKIIVLSFFLFLLHFKTIVLHLDTIDIADMQAVVQKLSDAPFNTYGSQYLQYRANYVLVKVFRKYL